MDTFESLTIQSVSVKKKPTAPKNSYVENENLQFLKIQSNDET